LNILLLIGTWQDAGHSQRIGRCELKLNHIEGTTAKNRITIPAADLAPAASRPLLQAVNKQLGVVPNLMKVLSNSSAALGGYLSLNGAIGKGALGVKNSERIALAIAEINRCSYCLAAHTYLGKNVAKLDDAEIAANRLGTSTDPKADAAVRFAAKVVLARGHVSDDDLQAV